MLCKAPFYGPIQPRLLTLSPRPPTRPHTIWAGLLPGRLLQQVRSMQVHASAKEGRYPVHIIIWT